jgi:CheY-like chemotaxis protein
MADPHTVLIVDDDEMVTATFGRMLQLDGFNVHTATEPAAGLTEAVHWQPDAIILDLRMPLMDGLGFLRRLRADPRGRGVPVAIVTGDYLIDDSALETASELGATVKFKPLWVDDLVTLVHDLLTRQPIGGTVHEPGSVPSLVS